MKGAIFVERGGVPGSVGAALRGVADDVVLLAAGGPGDALPLAATGQPVIVLDGVDLADAPAGSVAVVLEAACRRHGIDLLVTDATARGREIAGHLAVGLDAACVTEALALHRDERGTLLAERLLYGGLAVGTVALERRPAVVTMAFGSREGIGSGAETPGSVLVEPVVLPPASTRLVARERVEEAADLARARRIVAVGRGLRRREDLALIEELAAALGADIACSRPLAEDLRWLPRERQVGLTGQTVKPELYVAIGISGQIQHIVGMRDAGTIVAINTNPAAPIFGVADVGIVGDLYEVVPRLTAALAAETPVAG
jgi:electron transfer flavoprotein alpha subunit